MAKDQELIHVFGGEDDAAWLGPLGSTLPTTLAAPDAALIEVGYLGEDGIDHNRDTSVESFRAHQGGQIVRKKITEFQRDIVFRALENNDIVREVVDNIKSTTTATGVTTEVLSGAAAIWVGAAVFDVYDGAYMERYVAARFEIAPGGTETWSNSSLREWELTGTVIGDLIRISGPKPA